MAFRKENATNPPANGQARTEERRASLAQLSEVRTVSPDIVRSLSAEAQAALTLIRQARAACYGLMYYLCCMPYDAFADGIYGAFYECNSCCDLCLSLIGRESALSSAAYELCAAASRQVGTACTGIEDALITACVAMCANTADACEGMAAPGEGEEDRAGRQAGEEVRSCKLEIRSEGDGRKVVGYPIRFNDLSEDLGGFRERILPGAVEFADDVRADFNHNPNYILGRSTAGTLSLSLDTRGVRMEADAPETTWANDLLVSIRRGDINQGSFAFRVLPGGQQISEENGIQIRTLSKILVRKVSVVSDPAYTKTSIEVRSKANPSSQPASQAAPSARKSGGGIDHLRRLQTQAERE